MQRSLAPDNDIAQRWNQEMRDISTRAPSQPLGYYERQAQLEAEAENQRLKKALSNKPPEIIDDIIFPSYDKPTPVKHGIAYTFYPSLPVCFTRFFGS